MLNAERRTQNAECRTQNAERRTLNAERRVQRQSEEYKSMHLRNSLVFAPACNSIRILNKIFLRQGTLQGNPRLTSSSDGLFVVRKDSGRGFANDARPRWLRSKNNRASICTLHSGAAFSVRRSPFCVPFKKFSSIYFSTINVNGKVYVVKEPCASLI